MIVHGEMVDWARALEARAENGETLVLLYNFSVPNENLRDPVAPLERLYLGLGHEKFMERVFVFGSEHCRYDCLPIRPVEAFHRLLDAIVPAPLAGLVPISLDYHQGSGSEEISVMLDAAQAGLALQGAAPDGNGFVSSKIFGRRTSEGASSKSLPLENVPRYHR
jgi:hypothetical protein